MKKAIYFITQSKGGAGKSILTFILAEKYKEAILLDLDDATTTTIKQLAYRHPVKVSFLDRVTQRIDRGAFNGLFESVINNNEELFIADLGASVAEQLPKYFSLNGVDTLTEILYQSDVQLKIVCVVGGGTIFKSTMEYLDELRNSTNGLLEITIACNGFYPFSSEQKDMLDKYATHFKLLVVNFDLVKDKGEIAMRTVDNVLREGKGISNLDPFSLIYFKTSIEGLEL